MNKLKQFIIAGFFVAFGGLALLPSTVVYAVEPTDEACAAIGCDDPQGLDATGVVTTVTRIFSYIIGVAAVIMIMVAGFKYITASGDAAKISSAKNTIIYAVIGLIVAVLAQLIVQVVIDESIGATAKTQSIHKSA